jgi:hypothetical protein
MTRSAVRNPGAQLAEREGTAAGDYGGPARHLPDLLQQLLLEVQLIIRRLDDPVGVGHRLEQALPDSHLVER